MEEAEALSDRIGIMVNGHIKAVGTAAKLITETNTKSLEEAFILLATNKEAV